MAESTLRITEIFHSIQGESNSAGWPTVFVRLTGCPMRCQYCDTAYAFHGGEPQSIEDILARVAGYQPRFVTVTGGEPLAQKGCWPLLSALCDAGYKVSLETGGAVSTVDVDARVSIVLDVKTPGSGELKRNVWGNLSRLRAHDQVKFVICDHADYEWARLKVDEFQLQEMVADVLFSPSFDQQNSRELAEWILQDKLAVRLQLQMHKYLWGDLPGH